MTIDGTAQSSGVPRTITLGGADTVTPVTIVVTNQCGTTKTYTLNLHRASCSNDNALASITTNPAGTYWSSAFNVGTTTYRVCQRGNVTAVDVTATAADPFATVRITASGTTAGIGSATRTVTLGAMGTVTAVTIQVTSECGTAGTVYTVNLDRGNLTQPQATLAETLDA